MWSVISPSILVYCWKGLRFSARQDLEGFSRFTDLGIEGVVPPEILPPEVRSKLHSKQGEKTKRLKKEEGKSVVSQPEENQVTSTPVEIDVGGNGTELEEGAAPMDSDATVGEEGQKQSPDMDSGNIVGQSEAEVDAEVEGKTDSKVETEVKSLDDSPQAEANTTSTIMNNDKTEKMSGD